jgi:hypothetical protein
MTTVQACQHIYSNVEKDRSPQGRGGFQTLFYTRAGLTEDEVEEMESRLLYFPSNVEPAKRLFFTTSSGKGVVAQLVFLPKPDQYGRGGRYLAHSLVFTPDALAQFEADPFRVFRRFRFITSVDDALAQGDFATGDIPPIMLELPASLSGEVKAAGEWSASELKKLTFLALRAEAQAQARQAITVTGRPEQLEAALEAAFLVVPVSRRPQCAFDTYFHRCNLVATYFWAIGLPEPPVNIKFAQVDGATRQVRGEVNGQPVTAYERWVAQVIEAGQLANLPRDRDSAYALAEWLDGRAYDLSLLAAAPNELITAMFKVSPTSVQTLLRSQVRKQLLPALVDRAADYLYRQSSELTLYRQLRHGFDLPPLVESLYQSYADQRFVAPPGPELKALAEVLNKVHHPLLSLFWVYWANRKQLPKTLERVTEADYRQFGQAARQFNLVKPLELLAPGRGEAFLDLYLPAGVENLVDLVEALLKAGEVACLSRLTATVSELPGKELKELSKLIDDQPSIPEPFRRAVEQALAAAPPAGFKEVWRSLWRRPTDE